MATEGMSDDDAMAAEGAAALAESKTSEAGCMSGAVQTETVAPASFTNFAPTDGMSVADFDQLAKSPLPAT